MTTTGVSLFVELPVYPRASVDATAFLVNDFDLFQESHVGHCLSTDDMLTESVIATPGRVEQFAHEHDRMFMCKLADERVLHHGRRENTAIAF